LSANTVSRNVGIPDTKANIANIVGQADIVCLPTSDMIILVFLLLIQF